jgi:hypothetical protein
LSSPRARRASERSAPAKRDAAVCGFLEGEEEEEEEEAGDAFIDPNTQEQKQSKIPGQSEGMAANEAEKRCKRGEQTRAKGD